MFEYFLSIVLGAFLSPATAHIAEATRELAPKYLNSEEATAHATLAASVATSEAPVELLLSMAYYESRYSPESTSRLIKGEKKRRTGNWVSTKKPPNTAGNFYCGITQATAPTWGRCLELRDNEEAYRTTVEELSYWYNTSKCRGREEPLRTRCTLLGYGGGWSAIENNALAYPVRVMGRADLIKARAAYLFKLSRVHPFHWMF